VACVVVSYRDRAGRIEGSVTTAGSTLFDACSNAINFFNDPFWKGRKPTPEMVLEAAPVGLGENRRWRVKVVRVLQWRQAESKGDSAG
jgi:hypothetical protein